jgi:uncharacterized membrane protein
MNTSLLKDPVSIPLLRRLLADGHLTADEESRLEETVRRQLPWQLWADRGLLGIGVALMLSGVVYFFAHNWDHLTNADKLALAAGAVILSFVGSAWRGFDHLIGKTILFAASALVGVFIAVFGQVYQTGADSYQLFTAWALLIFPWVALGRCMPLWVLWLAVLDLAWGFYVPIETLWFGVDDVSTTRLEFVGLVAINGIALLVREVISGRGLDWLDRGWASDVFLAATITPASLGVIYETLRTWDNNIPSGAAFAATFVFAVMVFGLGYFYSRVRHSLPSLAIMTLAACSVLTFQAARIIDLPTPSGTSALHYLVQGLATLLIFGVGVFFLRSQRQTN